MKPINLKLSVKPEDRYSMYLRLVSSIFPDPLTDNEIKILNAFHIVSGGVINTDARNEVCKMLKINSLNLNNILKRIRDKQFISKDEKKLETITRTFNIDTCPEEKVLFMNIEMIS